MAPVNGVLPELLYRAAQTGYGVHFKEDGETSRVVSYAEVLERAGRLLGYFQQRGLKPGDKLILFVRNNRAFIDAFWACQLGGLVPVPLSAGLQAAALQKLTGLAGHIEDAWLFSERTILQRLKASSHNQALFPQRVCLLEDIHTLPATGELHQARTTDLALIQFSSGSTGSPRGVQLTHANLLANITAITSAAQITGNDVTLSWMPLSHDMGLIGFHLVPLYNGLSQVLMETSLFIRRPALWLESAAELGATLLCSPNFGYTHYLKAVAEPAAALDLHRVRLLFNGAEPVSAAVCREFLQRLSVYGLQEKVMFPVYGLAEASLAVTFPIPGDALKTISVATQTLHVGAAIHQAKPGEPVTERVCLGFPVDHCELRIVDEHGQLLSDGRLGHVQIRGDNVTSGYYRCRACDREVFADGWLDSGDLGFMSQQGLVITGRAREVIFFAGQNFYPQDIEALLIQAGIAEAGKVAVSAVRSPDNAEDQLLVFIQWRRELSGFLPVLASIKTELSAGAGLVPQAVLPIARLPKTTSGKLQRLQLADTYTQGGYADLIERLTDLMRVSSPLSPENAVEQALLSICQHRFPEHKIGVDQNLFELGADSLMLVGLHEDINNSFPGRVEITDLFEHPTVRALAAYIADQHA